MIIRRKYFLYVVNELKNRFRTVLFAYFDKKADRTFNEIKSMIENFDKNDKLKPKIGGKISKNRMRVGVKPPL